MSYTPHPGNLGYQLGLSLTAIRKNVEEEDLPGIRNQVRYTKALCLSKMSRERVGEYNAIPEEDEEWDVQFGLEMRRVETILAAMTDVNVYAWTEQEIQDAKALRLDGV